MAITSDAIEYHVRIEAENKWEMRRFVADFNFVPGDCFWVQTKWIEMCGFYTSVWQQSCPEDYLDFGNIRVTRSDKCPPFSIAYEKECARARVKSDAKGRKECK